MIRKQMAIVNIKVCDDCPEPKLEWSIETHLQNCYICGKDLCVDCAKKIGHLAFCKEHNKVVWDFIDELKKKHKQTNSNGVKI